MSRAEARQRAAAMAALGRKMFFDKSLSASGRMACASCHDPAYAYGPPESLPQEMNQGLRAVPSLRYLQTIPQFTEHYFDSEEKGDDSVDNGPTGGLTWDGRVDRGRQQARIPLLAPNEMANESPDAVVARARKAGYGEVTFETIAEAIETYQQNYREFYPYSSKFDRWMAGKSELSAQEMRGLKLFEDPHKGNCASCHTAERGTNGALPQFTDYGFAALGVPRNRSRPANRDAAFFDMGLCGPLRTDLRARTEDCGMFITPTLRNVATRHVFFHNGVIHSLREAVEFYATRDTNPARWYAGEKFDDLPAAFRHNVDTDAPFGRGVGMRPALTEPEVDDVVAFLQTLTDGYR